MLVDQREPFHAVGVFNTDPITSQSSWPSSLSTLDGAALVIRPCCTASDLSSHQGEGGLRGDASGDEQHGGDPVVRGAGE